MYLYTYIHTIMPMSMYTCMHTITCVYSFIYIMYIYVHVYMPACIHTYMHKFIHSYRHICILTPTHKYRKGKLKRTLKREFNSTYIPKCINLCTFVDTYINTHNECQFISMYMLTHAYINMCFSHLLF